MVIRGTNGFDIMGVVTGELPVSVGATNPSVIS